MVVVEDDVVVVLVVGTGILEILFNNIFLQAIIRSDCVEGWTFFTTFNGKTNFLSFTITVEFKIDGCTIFSKTAVELKTDGFTMLLLLLKLLI